MRPVRVAPCFGIELVRLIVEEQTSVTGLARKLRESKHRVSINHISDLTRSERRPSPALIDAIGRALNLGPDRLKRMHRAAALDRGFAIGGL